MSSSNFSIDNILAAAKSFSPSTTAMMFNAQQAFIALNSLPASIPSPIDFFNPYAFPPTTSQNSAFAAAQFPFWRKFLKTLNLYRSLGLHLKES